MERAVVFGCGHTSVQYREEIHKRFDVVAYSCNRPQKWGQEYDGAAIIEPSKIPEDVIILVASEEYYPEILLGLVQQGVKNPFYTIIEGLFVRCFPTKTPEQSWKYEFPELHTQPASLTVDLSGLCNSKCQYCAFHSEYGKEKKFPAKFMEEGILLELLQQIEHVQSFTTLKLIGHGEPMMHPQWQEYASQILKAGQFDTCWILTNGMLLTPENAQKLHDLPVKTLNIEISIDGFSPEDCEFWRKGEKFSVIRENVHRAYEILGERAEMYTFGCVVMPASVDINSHEEVMQAMNEAEAWRRKEFPFIANRSNLTYPYVDNIPGTKVVEVATLPRPLWCDLPFHNIAISNNGDILSCPCGPMYLNDENGGRIGNILKDNMLEIFYNHPRLNQMRRDFIAQKEPVPCRGCALCGENRILCLQRTE